MGSASSYINISTLTTAAMVVYLGIAARNFSMLLDPLAQLPAEVWRHSRPVEPLWPENSKVSFEMALSSLPELHPDLMQNESEYSSTTVVSWRANDMILNSTGDFGISIDLELYPAERGRDPTERDELGRRSWWWFSSSEDEEKKTLVGLPEAAWNALESNRSLFLHAAVYVKETSTRKGLSDNDIRRVIRLPPLALVKYEPPPTTLPKRKLLLDFGVDVGPPPPWTPPLPSEPGKFVAKWKPEAAVRVVSEFRTWPSILEMAGMTRVAKKVPGGRQLEYYAPPMLADEIGLTSDKYVSLNSSLDHLPLKISFSPLSFGRWQLIGRMEGTLRSQQEEYGFADKDVDDVRRLIADTPIWLLAVTILASALHLLFEFLAFKSDIDFWRNNKSLTGLSARSVVVELVSQCVILAFLVDEGSSLLVSVPAACGIVVQAWKVRKATGLTFDSSKPFFFACPRLTADAGANAKSRAEAEKCRQLYATTQRVDSVATFYLTALLLPLVFGWALKSLVFDAHRSWYSWALSSATASVYTFGFILMTPQLALNYTLKSVSHLPWKLLCFRFVNTFIDDLFSFIIKMPTMHRISCFRDDAVFLVYLYQRRIYPVDLARGTAAEDSAH